MNKVHNAMSGIDQAQAKPVRSLRRSMLVPLSCVAIMTASIILLVFPGTASAAGKPGNFAVWDANGDGRLELQEYLATRSDRFKRLDLDQDGFLTSADKEKAGVLTRVLAYAKGGKGIQRLQAMDADKDDKVSLEEYLASGKARFEAIDANRDGWATEQEYQRFQSAKQAGTAPAGRL